MAKIKAIFNGKEIEITLSKKAEKELADLKEKICNDCCLMGDGCDTIQCKIRL